VSNLGTRHRARGRFTVRNGSRYPTAEVRQLIRFATADVDMRAVCVNVKRLRLAGWRGWAYPGVPDCSNAPAQAEYLITLAVGESCNWPMRRARQRRGEPYVEFADWRETLVYLAAHEAKHIEQFREGLPVSEVRCNVFAAATLSRYREGMGDA
jgi:hypothetical protein